MKARRSSDELFRLAIEASPAAMILTGRDGRIRFVNVETEIMFGYSTAELVGTPIDMLVPSTARRSHAQLREHFFAQPSKRSMGVGRDLRAVRRDGREFPVEIGLTPIETKREALVLATVLDITARRDAESALAQRAAELEQANERLAQFAYVASHDLREPLRKIAIFSDLLTQALAASNREDALHANDVIGTSALRAQALVDDLLTYSRIIHGGDMNEELDMRDEIDAALEDLSQMIRDSGSEIDNAAQHLRFKADRAQFARLMHNIIANAIKYRKPDQIAKVRILVAPVGDNTIRLAISDNGIGFEPKYATIIFEPFKRLHSAAKYPGSGIGLAICKSIADRHGWKLSISSNVGAGATFFIEVPRIFAAAPIDKDGLS